MNHPVLKLAILVLGVALAACGGYGEESASTAESAGTTAPVAERLAGDAFAGTVVYTNLLERAHLTDVHHQGYFVDFGTPGQVTATAGGWNTGWLSQGVDADTAYAHVGQRAWIYFPIEEVRTHTARLRLKAIGTGAMTVFLNGRKLIDLSVRSGSFHDVDFTMPADRLREGENYVQLLFGGTGQVNGEAVSAAIDSLRVVSGDSVSDAPFDAPRYATLVTAARLGGVERQAFGARRPTRLSHHVQVPENGKLGFGVGFEGEGQANVRVRVTPEGGSTSTVFEGQANGSWSDQVVDLSAHANNIVRIDFEALGEGTGRVLWSQPSILIPTPPNVPSGRAKNVIVLLIDTLPAQKLRIYNRESRVETPVLDRLASEGTVYDSAQTVEPWTKPSVASVLTGLYPQTHGAREMTSVLGDDAVLLSEHLKANGFATGAFIANGYVGPRFGFRQGWDHYTNYIREGKSTEAENVFRETAEWIGAHRDERFFAYVQTIDPHVPYDPPESYIRRYDARTDYTGQVQPRMTAELLEHAKGNNPSVTFDRSDRRRLEALYDAEVTQHDHFLGQFIDQLQEMGVWEDTLLIVTSDHGEAFAEHGSNDWGHGHSIFQNLLHVPLIARLPGVIPAGRRVAATVGTAGIPATVVELTGAPAMETVEVPSFASYAFGGVPAWPSVAFSDKGDDRRVVLAGRYKFLMRHVRTTAMFDLGSDAGEQNQLAVQARPIAGRYVRAMLGLYAGARDRGNWISPEQSDGTQVRSRSRELDATDEAGLRELGYIVD